MSDGGDVGQPLLAGDPSPSSSQKPIQTEIPIPVSRSSLSFFRQHEGFGGVPTLHLKPSDEESRFTSYALSKDGSCFITGENDGTVRLWSTVDYSLLADCPSVFDRPIDCLSFLDARHDAFVGADTRGIIKECSFLFDKEGRARTIGAKRFQNIRETQTRREDEDGTRLHVATRQFSNDGRTFVCGPWQAHQPIDVLRLGQSIEQITIAGSDEVKYRFPVLAPNSQALLVTEERNSGQMFQMVAPFMSFADELKFVAFEGERGLWGKMGSYLMIWTRSSGRPLLTVLPTTEVSVSTGNRKRLFLEHGLARWTAQMMDGPDLSVAILTVSSNGRHRVLLWDVESDLVKHEVLLSTDLFRPIERSKRKLYGQDAEDIVESVAPTRSAESTFDAMMEDLVPKLCITKDGVWVGLFSWRFHAGVVCSLVSSITVWSFALPESIRFDPFQMWNRALFDPSGRRFVFMGDVGIFVSAPPFLEPGDEGFEQWEYVTASGSFTDAVNHPLETFGCLPTEAFSATWSAADRAKNWKVSVKKEPIKVRSVRDVSISEDGSLLAVIAFVERDIYVVTAPVAEYQRMNREGVFSPRVFPMKDTFDHSRVFLYKNERDEDAMVLIAAGFKGVLTFCDLEEKTMMTVALDMERCNKVTHTTDRRRLVLLDNKDVCIVDLWQRRIVERIPYEADFRRIVHLTLRGRKWIPQRTFIRERTSERRVSEDGRSVLIAWDAIHNRSILLKPSMAHEECEAMVKSDEKFISECCVLSRNGEVTLFVDIDAFFSGRLVVGVFDESTRTTTYRVDLRQTLATDMPNEVVRQILASVFYDISADGTTLSTITTSTEPSSPSRLRRRMTKFGVRGSDLSVSSYNQLMADVHFNANALTTELFNRFGGSVFNSSANGRTTLFQEAVHRRHWTLAESIQEIAVRHDLSLGLDRLDAVSTRLPNHWLLHSLLTASTNDIRSALDLVRSRTTPFDRASSGINAAFKALSFNHPEIMQEMLSKSKLIVQVCVLDVHVGFMHPRIREDRGIHIGTANTYSEWTTITDPIALEQNWRHHNEDAVKDLEHGGNTSTTKAALIFICIRDAAKVGMRGVIRPLLLQKAPPHVYRFDVVKHVIMYKWLKIWQSRFVTNVFVYIVFLVDYTVYAIVIGLTSSLAEEERWIMICSSTTLAIAFAFGCKMLAEEITQVGTFIKEGHEQKLGWTWGLRYHFSSRWNWVDAVSCVMLLVLLPLFHGLAFFNFYASFFEHCLSAAVAVEAIIASLKMGALVLMVDNILRDCIAFLALAAMILFGFGLGIYVLFRHADRDDPLYNEIQDAFGSFDKALMTMFYALLGTFEPEVFHSAGKLSPMVVAVFSLFSVVEMIVLLNLLIAIMGDTFDKVKSTEESHLLMGRAIFIDACEAALTQREVDALNDRIGKYVYVVVPLEEETEIDPNQQWMGRLTMLMENFRYKKRALCELKYLYVIVQKIKPEAWASLSLLIVICCRVAIKKTEQRVLDVMRNQTEQLEGIAATAARDTMDAVNSQATRISEIADGLSAREASTDQPNLQPLPQSQMDQPQHQLEALLEERLGQLEEKTISMFETVRQKIENDQKLNLDAVADRLTDTVMTNATRLEALEAKLEEMGRRHSDQLETILSLLQHPAGGGADEA